MPGNTSVAVTPNLNSSHANAFSLFQHFNQNTNIHSISCEYGSYHKACSLNSILISLANEMSLSSTLVIMSLKASDLVHKSTFEEIYVFLPDFQVIIQLDDLTPDFLSSVIIVFWTVWDYHSI